MLNSMKLRQRILLGYAIPVLLMFAIAWLADYSGTRVSHSIDRIDQENDLLRLNQRALRDLLDNETGFRGYVITGNEAFLEPLERGRQGFDTTIDRIRVLTSHEPDRLVKWNHLATLIERQLIPWQDSLIQIRRKGGAEGFATVIALIHAGTEKKIMDEARAQIEELRQMRLTDYNEAHKEGHAALDAISEIAFIGAGVAAVVAMFAGFLISSGIVRTINDTVTAISTSASQIAATVNEQERMATQQAAAVNETTATMDELGASSRQSAEQAETISAVARESLSLADEGAKAVGQTLDAMAELKDRVESIAEQILRLSEHTSQIGNITNLVGDLASQTNLLALNAAVEAARAGEHGKGFAVVAAEIRKLADQSKRSAERINMLVADIQKATNSTVMVTEEGTKTLEEGVRLVNRTGEAFNTAADSVGGTFESVQQISLNMKQQAAAIRQVVDAMSSLNTGAKETAIGITQTKGGVQNLVDAAHLLKAMV